MQGRNYCKLPDCPSLDNITGSNHVHVHRERIDSCDVYDYDIEVENVIVLNTTAWEHAASDRHLLEKVSPLWATSPANVIAREHILQEPHRLGTLSFENIIVRERCR